MTMSSGTRLFVGNLPRGLENLERELKKEFSQYGTVSCVEVKAKKDVEGMEVEKFAFVTMESDNYTVKRCIEELGVRQWKGVTLRVSQARESFLQRLQRERQAQEAPPVIANDKIEKINIRIPEKKFPRDYEHANGESNSHSKAHRKNEIGNDRIEKINAEKRFSNDFDETSSKLNMNVDKAGKINAGVGEKRSASDFEHTNGSHSKSVEKSVRPKRPKRPKNVEKMEGKGEGRKGELGEGGGRKDEVGEGEIKRLRSLDAMRSSYQQRRNLVRQALASVDRRANRITFDDDDERCELEPVSAGDTKHDRRHLFDESSGDEEEMNFDVKEHFHGEQGQKLLELQSRYRSDKRFTLDARFLEEEELKEEGQEPRVKKDGPRVKGEESRIKGDESRMNGEESRVDEEGEEPVEGVVWQEEKQRERDILRGILGGVTIPTRTHKQAPVKTMLRYDPSRPEHARYTRRPPSPSPTVTVTAAPPGDSDGAGATVKVSQERYYQVNQSLKEVMGSSSTGGSVSLLSMFGRHKDDDDGGDTLNAESQYQVRTIERSRGEEKGETEEEQGEGEEVKGDDKGDIVGGLAVKEMFFFSHQDTRLLEGLSFFLSPREAVPVRSRVELKHLVKRRIRNNMRNHGGQFPNTIMKRHGSHTARRRRRI